jgi:hypothetical protein
MTTNAPAMIVGQPVDIVAASTFTRPADTTAYASGDLVANSTTAGSVTPMTFSVGRGGGAGGMIKRVRIVKSGTTATNAAFRLHLYTVSPTCANGDNGAWSTSGVAGYHGYMDVAASLAFTDGCCGLAASAIGTEINFTVATLYGLLEARAAYTPASGETFTVSLEVLPN